MDDTRSRIVELLRVRGGQTVQDLARSLHLTRTAVVSHLSALRAEGLVTRGGLRAGRRRPSTLYVVTDAADWVFPKRYEEFAAALLDGLKRDNPKTFTRVLERLGDGWVARDLPRVGGLHGRARVKMAQQILRERGFLPTLEWSAGAYTLREHNCPVMILAAAHPDICAAVHRWLEALVGMPLARNRCMAQGASFSEYVARTAPVPGPAES
ncbi:MAG TPA: ArsR family transcriptional regulator [bacterium]|nr:ArsR family transcriptional regulator [bacterium]